MIMREKAYHKDLGAWSAWHDTEVRMRLGVSTCLLGEEVRFDGGHARNRFVIDVLGNWFEWVPVCPEVEIGMGIPRPAIGLNILKKGAASAPQPATHCHPSVLLARSASTSLSQNHSAPSCHGISRSLTRKEATIIRTRLCIHPVDKSCLIPASTIG